MALKEATFLTASKAVSISNGVPDFSNSSEIDKSKPNHSGFITMAKFNSSKITLPI